MGMKSLRSGFMLLANPCLWIAPVVFAVFAYFQLAIAVEGTGLFLSEKIGIIWLVTIPFFLSATYGCIKKNDFSARSYLKEGISGYFKVLIPGLLLFMIAMIIIATAFIPAISGEGGLLLFLIMAVFLVPFVLLTFFFDTAAIFEGKKVFESIKRSIELSGIKTAEIISFYAVLLLLVIILGFGLMIIWSALLTDQLMPLAEMTSEEINRVSSDPDALRAILGGYGVFITSVTYAAGIFISSLVFIPFKAVFYRDVLLNARPEHIVDESQGEYDEKGRWYRYS